MVMRYRGRELHSLFARARLLCASLRPHCAQKLPWREEASPAVPAMDCMAPSWSIRLQSARVPPQIGLIRSRGSRLRSAAKKARLLWRRRGSTYIRPFRFPGIRVLSLGAVAYSSPTGTSYHHLSPALSKAFRSYGSFSKVAAAIRYCGTVGIECKVR